MFDPIFVYSVHLESGELVQKYASTTEPPEVGEKIILDIDRVFKRFKVLGVTTATQDDYEYYVVKVSDDTPLS
jgi:hypothetical protein